MAKKTEKQPNVKSRLKNGKKTDEKKTAKASGKATSLKKTVLEEEVIPTDPVSGPLPPPIVSRPIEEPIGAVTHYYSHLGVAIIDMKLGALSVSDTIHIKGSTTDFKQPVQSIEVDHKPVTKAKARATIGVKVVEPVREHDHVYIVNAESVPII